MILSLHKTATQQQLTLPHNCNLLCHTTATLFVYFVLLPHSGYPGTGTLRNYQCDSLLLALTLTADIQGKTKLITQDLGNSSSHGVQLKRIVSKYLKVQVRCSFHNSGRRQWHHHLRYWTWSDSHSSCDSLAPRDPTTRARLQDYTSLEDCSRHG